MWFHANPPKRLSNHDCSIKSPTDLSTGICAFIRLCAQIRLTWSVYCSLGGSFTPTKIIRGFPFLDCCMIVIGSTLPACNPSISTGGPAKRRRDGSQTLCALADERWIREHLKVVSEGQNHHYPHHQNLHHFPIGTQ